MRGVIGSHVIPRFYLEQFATRKKAHAKTGYLWVYSTSARIRRGTAQTEGVENGYFGMPTATDRLDESLETQLAALEDRAKDVLLMAPNETFVWSRGYQKILADYVALLYARTKARRNATAWVSDAVSKNMLRLIEEEQFMRELTDEYAKRFNQLVDVSVVKRAVKSVADEAVTPDGKRGFFLSELLNTANLVSEILLSRPWQVWKAPEGQESITSDNPVVTMLPINGDFAHGFGFNAQGVLVACPLNWNSCLLVGAPDNKTFKEVDAQTLERTNEIQIRCMFQNAYSRTKFDHFEAAVKQYGATSKFGENAFVVPGDFLPQMKEFLRKRVLEQQQ